MAVARWTLACLLSKKNQRGRRLGPPFQSATGWRDETGLSSLARPQKRSFGWEMDYSSDRPLI